MDVFATLEYVRFGIAPIPASDVKLAFGRMATFFAVVMRLFGRLALTCVDAPGRAGKQCLFEMLHADLRHAGIYPDQTFDGLKSCHETMRATRKAGRTLKEKEILWPHYALQSAILSSRQSIPYARQCTFKAPTIQTDQEGLNRLE